VTLRPPLRHRPLPGPLRHPQNQPHRPLSEALADIVRRM